MSNRKRKRMTQLENHEEEKEKETESSTMKRDPKCYVYVLESMKTGRTYVGYTVRSVIKRLRKHNGIIKNGAKSTRRSRPFRVVMYLTASRSWFGKIPAQQLEWAIKHYTKRIYSKGNGKQRRKRRFKKIKLDPKQSLSTLNGPKKHQSWIQRFNAILWLLNQNSNESWTASSPQPTSHMYMKLKIHSDFFQNIYQQSDLKTIQTWMEQSPYWRTKVKQMSEKREKQIDQVLKEYKLKEYNNKRQLLKDKNVGSNK